MRKLVIPRAQVAGAGEVQIGGEDLSDLTVADESDSVPSVGASHCEPRMSQSSGGSLQ